jgi:hypothetical protein
MRYHFAVLMLIAVLPVMNVLAAPAPDPYAILDIGPPPKGMDAEQYRKMQIDCLTFPHGRLFHVWRDPEVSKMPSVATFKDARPWLSKNLRVTQEEGGRRLRLTFRAGDRREQVAILNSLLRITLELEAQRLSNRETQLQRLQEAVPRLEKMVATEQNATMLSRYRKDLQEAPSIIADLRAEIARCKQFTVIKWAK